MKRKRIVPAIVLLFVLLLAGMYVTRNRWVAYALQRTLYSQSSGQISLNFNKIDVDVFSKMLTISKPRLAFKEVYFNKAKGIMLKKAEFQKLILINISLWDIIIHKQLICDNLTIDQPTFILRHNYPAVKAKTSFFVPGSLIDALQKHEITHLNFQFLIRHSKINFGKIRVNKEKGKDTYGSARYNMSIENLGTIRAAGDSLHPLIFKKFELSVRAFHRHSIAERMDIKFDSAFFSSQSNSLFLNGLQVVSSDKSKTKSPLMKLYLRWAKISGLEITKQKQTGKKILQLNNIKVVGGIYTFQSKRKKQRKKSVSELLNNLFSTYNILSLDTLNLKHVHLFQVDSKQDTLLRIKRMDIEMYKIWVTKKILTNPLENLHYQGLSASYRKMTFGGKKSPFSIHSGEAQYISGNKQLVINHLKIRTRCKTDTSLSVSFSAGKLSIDSLSDKMFQKGEDQLLAVKLEFPEFYWKKDSSCQQKPITFPSVFHPFNIEEISIRNGSFDFETNRNLVLNISGINFFANGLQGTILRGPDALIQYDSLFFNSKSCRLDIANTGQWLETKELLWNNRFFKISGLRFLQSDTMKQDTLSIRSVTFTKPKLNPLIFDQKFIAGEARLYKASFSQYFQDSVSRTDTLPAKHWNNFIKLPFKTDIAYVYILKSRFSLTSRRPGKDFSISSRLNMKLHGFKAGYDTSHLISQPNHWEAVLQKTKIRQNNLTIRLERTNLNSDSATLQIKDISLRQRQDSSLQFRINIPYIHLLSLDYSALLHSDSLIFGKAFVQQGQGRMQFINSEKDNIDKQISRWAFVYDSIILNHAYLQINIKKDNSFKTISIDNLNLLYHPNMRHRNMLSETPVNLMKYWDFSIKDITYSDTLRKFHIEADRIAIQSAGNSMSIQRIIGTNFSASLLQPALKNAYTYFLINNISLSNINLSDGRNKKLYIKNWSVPGMWINIIDNDTTKKKRSLSFLSSNFFSHYTHILNSIHVDSSSFKNVNFSYQYDNMSKLVNIKNTDININDIQMGESSFGKPSGALFGTMLISLNDRAVISGDSMYTFRTKDIRINLAARKISLDSITLTPRYNRDDFFAKTGHQTDRITLYGKSATLDNFNPDDLLNNHFIHFGNLRLDNLSLRFERNMNYPRKKVFKPMPIDMLERIPYRFRIDSMQLLNSMISYFEYEVVSKNPGVFFIDNFNVLAENITNVPAQKDSNMVLKFHGSGKLMKQANLDFTLVMPYFAPHRQWWFSAEAGQIDLTQFNLLTENVLGLTVLSGKGSLEVPLITGNDTAAKGSVNFLYKNLKLRLYNRKKSQKSKKFYSPFANFMMNRIIIHSNNPPFLGQTKKGIVYFKRIPEKSFINYLWKSNLSGILSTLGFNNKQQREGKREDKKQTKSENKNKPNPGKKK